MLLPTASKREFHLKHPQQTFLQSVSRYWLPHEGKTVTDFGNENELDTPLIPLTLHHLILQFFQKWSSATEVFGALLDSDELSGAKSSGWLAKSLNSTGISEEWEVKKGFRSAQRWMGTTSTIGTVSLLCASRTFSHLSKVTFPSICLAICLFVRLCVASISLSRRNGLKRSMAHS